MKKYQYIIIAILLFLSLYLYLSHAFIYREIFQAGLKASDNQHAYNFIPRPDGTKVLNYAALGDSLTAGVGVNDYKNSYPYVLAKNLAGKDKNLVHKNFSYPGARTENLINDLLVPAIADQPDLITILIGTNDVHGFVSAEKFKNNYDYILKQLSSQTDAKIYAISLPPIGSRSLILPPWNFYFGYQTKKFNRIIRALANKYGAEYIDLASPTAKISEKDGAYYAADSFHPSAAGYKLWAKIIYEHIDR